MAERKSRFNPLLIGFCGILKFDWALDRRFLFVAILACLLMMEMNCRQEIEFHKQSIVRNSLRNERLHLKQRSLIRNLKKGCFKAIPNAAWTEQKTNATSKAGQHQNCISNDIAILEIIFGFSNLLATLFSGTVHSTTAPDKSPFQSLMHHHCWQPRVAAASSSSLPKFTHTHKQICANLCRNNESFVCCCCCSRVISIIQYKIESNPRLAIIHYAHLTNELRKKTHKNWINKLDNLCILLNDKRSENKKHRVTSISCGNAQYSLAGHFGKSQSKDEREKSVALTSLI